MTHGAGRNGTHDFSLVIPPPPLLTDLDKLFIVFGSTDFLSVYGDFLNGLKQINSITKIKI
jgi:hypothetical protein